MVLMMAFRRDRRLSECRDRIHQLAAARNQCNLFKQYFAGERQFVGQVDSLITAATKSLEILC
jgi:regulator of sirC expression with transglutaminase-like and TPR domain